MASGYDEGVIEFLARKENIAHALEVYRRVPEMQRKLREQYWTELKTSLEAKLSAGEGPGWKIEVHGTMEGKNSTIRIVEAGRGEPYLFFAVERDDPAKEKHMCVGVYYTQEQLPSSPEVTSLMERLVVGEDCEKYEGAAWLVTTTSPEDDDFYIGIAQDSRKVVGEAADRLWDLFKRYHAEVVRINEKLTAKSQ
jgi:hypothetical protein